MAPLPPPAIGPPQANRLLAGLPDAELAALRPLLRPVYLEAGQVLYEPGIKPAYLYFPTTAITALLYVLADGATSQFAMTGRDGLIGINLLLGGNSTSNSAIVQNSGWAWQVRATDLQAAFPQGSVLFQQLLRYAQCLITQIAQTTICNRHHSIEQQMGRWLLATIDRLPGLEVAMTQELLATMMGVRREGITEAAGKLQRAGLIHYHRGHITVLDRKALDAHACECYRVVRAESVRLLPPLPAPAVDSTTSTAADSRAPAAA